MTKIFCNSEQNHKVILSPKQNYLCVVRRYTIATVEKNMFYKKSMSNDDEAKNMEKEYTI